MNDRMRDILNGRPRENDPRDAVPGGDILPAVPSADRYLAEVNLGMARFQEVVKERDEYRKQLEEATLANERMQVRVTEAAADERIHVAELETQAGILRDEIAHLRRELSELQAKLVTATAREMGLIGRLELIRAAFDQTINEAALGE